MKINFYSDSDLAPMEDAVLVYQHLWAFDGERIVSSWEKHAETKFRESFINAIVFEGRSMSHPLSFRANCDAETKKATLVHELGHRILYKRLGQIRPSSLEIHKVLCLVLREVWEDLYGKEFADHAVLEESKFPMYKEAWDFALAMTPQERKIKFLENLTDTE